MKNFALLAPLLLLSSTFASANELIECQQKLASILASVPTTEVKGPSGQLDQYHLSKDGTCGVEYLSREGYFTVTRFQAVEGSDPILKKFETILLNENSFAGGRVKGSSACEIDGDTIRFETKLPIFSDGVRSPVQLKTLVVSKSGSSLSVNLKAKLSFLKSPIDCTLDL